MRAKRPIALDIGQCGRRWQAQVLHLPQPVLTRVWRCRLSKLEQPWSTARWMSRSETRWQTQTIMTGPGDVVLKR